MYFQISLQTASLTHGLLSVWLRFQVFGDFSFIFLLLFPSLILVKEHALYFNSKFKFGKFFFSFLMTQDVAILVNVP